MLSCGLSVTTLEEVFLKVSAGSEAALDQKQAAAYSQPQAVSLSGLFPRDNHEDMMVMIFRVYKTSCRHGEDRHSDHLHIVTTSS